MRKIKTRWATRLQSPTSNIKYFYFCLVYIYMHIYMGSIHNVLFKLLKPLNFNVFFSWILQVLCFQIFCIFHTIKPFDAMVLTFVTETITTTDEGQPRPKYIFNKYGTNIYFFTLQRFGASPSPNFKLTISIWVCIYHKVKFYNHYIFATWWYINLKLFDLAGWIAWNI